jgi:hypothetical protein
MLAPNPGHEPAPASAPAEPKLRIITLTNRAPIQIVEDEWPEIAHGQCGYECPGGADIYNWEISIRIRQQSLNKNPTTRFDMGGRSIIHAKYSFWDESHEEDARTVRVGRLVDENVTAEKFWKHILAVGDELRERIGNEKHRQHVIYAVDGCFADLKPHKNY